MDSEKRAPIEPRGFGEHTRGLSGEYAHEQGWGLDVEERTRLARVARDGPQDVDGGREYDYGAGPKEEAGRGASGMDADATEDKTDGKES